MHSSLPTSSLPRFNDDHVPSKLVPQGFTPEQITEIRKYYRDYCIETASKYYIYVLDEFHRKVFNDYVSSLIQYRYKEGTIEHICEIYIESTCNFIWELMHNKFAIVIDDRELRSNMEYWVKEESRNYIPVEIATVGIANYLAENWICFARIVD